MKRSTEITALFLDIGGVLLTDGWGHQVHKRAATNFKLEWAEMEERHQLNFDTYEAGMLTSTCTKLASFGLQSGDGDIHEFR
jgi:putative hydrolase of the HAD superfamily